MSPQATNRPSQAAQTPSSHTSPAPQSPQSTAAPQLSATSPQRPAQVVGSGTGMQSHRPGTPPPPHVSGRTQVPQETICPQLLGTRPQVLRARRQAVDGASGAQTHVPRRQVSPAAQQVASQGF
jgi:hypothetical protein